MALSKPKREIYLRKIKNFWIDFSHNKIGFAGLIIIIFYVIIAICAPILTPYPPESQLYKPPKVAARYAYPEWFRLFPQYRDLNPTINVNPDLGKATLIEKTGTLTIDLTNLWFNFTSTKRGEKAYFTLDLGNFTYDYNPPPSMTMRVYYELEYNNASITIYYTIKNYTANPLYEEYFIDPTKAKMKINVQTYDPRKPWGYIRSNFDVDSFVNSPSFPVLGSLFKPTATLIDPAEIIFSKRGTYGIQVSFEFTSIRAGGYANLKLKYVGLTIWGRCHGILGTNNSGFDVWTELVYGARISLLVGLLAALIGTGIGVLYGVVSGYLGGFVDEFLMRVVDVLLCIPVLPILLVLVRYFSANVFLIVVLIAIFGWQGLSRVIRSRVLSLKEMAFIESARASGASDFYLIMHHLIPNVTPIAIPALILSIPGAIITEASLSFLGFGDPNAATWGRILYGAYQLGGLPAWWVWLPPGLAITILCLGFVFIGHAVDEIVNPRLRMRR
uniref:ABC transporter permease n=1 Tax=Fervidobacterium pennivorans TaxID=93466 RepID=A0A7C4VUY9_FERPE